MSVRSSQTTSSGYSIGQAAAGIVKDVYPFGVFLELPDGVQAYVRRRELSVDGDIDPREVVSVDETIRGIVCALADEKHVIELSVRMTLEDPWPEYIRSIRPGGSVIATVKSISYQNVLVQIKTGVNGYISADDLAFYGVHSPNELLWVGDRVEGEIVEIDVAQKRLRLSIRNLFEKQSLTRDILAALHSQEAGETHASQSAEKNYSELMISECAPIRFTKKVLLVEDHQPLLQELESWLQARNVNAASTVSGYQALQLLQQEEFGLVVVDLDMPDMDGVTLIRRIRGAWPELAVVVMSDINWIAQKLKDLVQLNVQAILPKPIDLNELRQLLENKEAGKTLQPLPQFKPSASPEYIRTYRELAGAMRSRQPLDQRFQSGIEQLLKDCRAELTVLFRLDPNTGSMSIVANSGSLPINPRAILGLVESPVKDVIREDSAVWEGKVTQEHPERFRKLLDLLSFEACIGLAVPWGDPREYGLFIFHSQPEFFTRYRIRDVHAVANLFAAALESQNIDQQVRASAGIILSGTLAAGFAHEINNTIQTLDLKFSNLQARINNLGKNQPAFFESEDYIKLTSAVEKTIRMAQDLKQNVANYRQLVEARKSDQAAVNSVIRQAVSQVELMRRNAEVSIALSLREVLPNAHINPVALLQIFLNLVVNAIQQLEIKNKGNRTIEISSKLTGDFPQVIQVRFKDSGPGIHYHRWRKIFEAGITTREGGSGLGLFIAQNLVEAYGGRILVEESLIPFGSTFLIELPVAESKQMKNGQTMEKPFL